ncbi:MAG: hypothetical protein HUJ51_02660 [Eggerthellaceae bacterium]|nr:hypothetical protein [Eggerthellaceae bacterium]
MFINSLVLTKSAKSNKSYFDCASVIKVGDIVRDFKLNANWDSPVCSIYYMFIGVSEQCLPYIDNFANK